MVSANSILRKARSYLQKRAFTILGLTHRLSSGYDVTVRNKMEWIIYNDIFVEGDYDEAILDALSSEEENINFLDLGGNVGYFELRAAHLLARHKIRKNVTVHIVEGSNALCKEIKLRTYQLNSLMQIRIHHGLAGLRAGHGTLYEFEQHGLNSLFRTKGRAVEVPYLDISKECRELEKIHLMKVDIEGSELTLIQQYPDLLAKTRALVIEFHPEFCDTLACQQLLEDDGFTIHKSIKDYENCSVHLFLKP